LKENGLGKGTKERLLDTAEWLFAMEGIQATSLRDITVKAHANLAAVNYHFGTKDKLTEAVFARRLIPLNRERLRLLDEAEARAGDQPPSLQAILLAIFTPSVQLWREVPFYMYLEGRLQYEPDEKLHLFFLSHLEEVVRRFSSAMTRALPDVPLEELFWRMHFLYGAMIHTWFSHTDLERISGGLCKVEDLQEIVDRLVAFGVSGFRAPVSKPERPA